MNAFPFSFWMTPSYMLKKLVMGHSHLQFCTYDRSIARSVEFMAERLDTLSQPELASRLTLNCANCYVEPQRFQSIPVTILDVSIH